MVKISGARAPRQEVLSFMTKIDIFSGFLGAGKTTLIKKLIAEAYTGEKIVLIENEFGEIAIDGGFLKDSGVQINEMNSGCICCSLVGDFADALKKVLEHVYRGMIYRRMRESLTAMQAGVFVSILFGVGHGNLPQGLYAMVLGFLLAGIYEKFRNIAAPVLFHIVVNITSLLLSWYGGFEWILGTEGKAVGITVLATLITVIIYVKIKNIRQEIR